MRKAALLLAGLALGALSAMPAVGQETIRIGALIKNESNPFFLTMAEGYRLSLIHISEPTRH